MVENIAYAQAKSVDGSGATTNRVLRYSLLALKAPLWIAAAALAMMVFLAITTFPKMQAAQVNLQRERAAAVEAENREVCGRFKFRQGSDEFAACARELDDVRAHEEQRFVDDTRGLL